MKIYTGKIENGRKVVTVNGHPLRRLYPSNPRRNVPFDWGKRRPSTGTIHLAEAILADHTGSRIASSFAQGFAGGKLADLPSEWRFTSEDIKKWLRISAGIGPSCVLHIPNDLPKFPSLLDNLRERIGPDELARQGFPRPKEVRLSRNVDSTGDDAYYVYLVFPDRTPEGALAWEKIEPMVSWVRNLIWTETGARLWPYVKVKRRKQLVGGMV